MLMLTGFFENMFRSIFFFLDKIVYGFMPLLYNFIQILAKQQLLSQPTIQKFANNVYALLAIFMLFRLAFVLLNAIIDPDKLTNKEKGFGKIMTRFITGMFLIVIIPWVFDYAFRLQDMILEKDIMTKIVFGADAKQGATAGDTLAKTTLTGFYYCSDNSMTPVQATDDEGNPLVDVNGNPAYTYTCDLADAYNQAFPSSTAVGGGHNWGPLSDNLNVAGSDGDYKYSYSAGISTVCGIVILLMLVTFSFDVAVRVVKLAFLQLMTPVAVVGYIEPGGKRFNTWLQMCISTFLNLFIRLLALSITSFIITLLDPNKFTPVDLQGNPLQSFMMSSFVRIFIIIGSLLFVKEGPKMLSDILGIKEAGIGGLNPFKKLGGMVGAGFIGGAAALGMKGVGGLAGGVAGGWNAKSRGGSFWAGAGQGLKAGAGNIKLKDAYKGGVTGIGKSLKGGTYGAWNKGGSYAASKVTGKEEKVGFINNIKKDMASKASEMHVHASETADKKRWEELQNTKKQKGSYYSQEYQKSLNNIKDAKDQLKKREDSRSYWQGLYANNPAGSYVGTDGNTYSFKEAYERANGNVISAQKNLDYFKGELDKMNKLDAFKDDAETKAFVDKMSAEDDYGKIRDAIELEKSGTLPYDQLNNKGVDDRKIKPIINYERTVEEAPNNSNSNTASNFKVENGEVKTKSGIIMPGGFNPNDPRNK